MKKLILLLFIPLVSFGQTFCDGWEAGYEKGLESCMKMGITPTCPTPKMLADTYGDGYGLGYKKAKEKCNYESPSSSSGAYENPQLGITDYTAFSKGVNEGIEQTMKIMSVAKRNRNNLSSRNKISKKWKRGVSNYLYKELLKKAEKNKIYISTKKAKNLIDSFVTVRANSIIGIRWDKLSRMMKLREHIVANSGYYILYFEGLEPKYESTFKP